MNDFMALSRQQKVAYVAEIIAFHAVWLWIGYQLMSVGGGK